ncbi:hypothetical protein GH733_016119, partial [Mirounga leonina]
MPNLAPGPVLPRTHPVRPRPAAPLFTAAGRVLQPLAADRTESSWPPGPAVHALRFGRSRPHRIPGLSAASSGGKAAVGRRGVAVGRRGVAVGRRGVAVGRRGVAAGARPSGRKWGTRGGPRRVSVTRFLASAPETEKRAAGAPRVCTPADGAAAGLPGRASSEPRAMASEGPREPVGEKLYTEDVAFGASPFPPQYLSSELALHPCRYSPYPVECSQSGCPVPGSQYACGRPSAYRGFQTVRPRGEQMCPVPQDSKALFKKKTYEQKFDSKKADGSLSSDIKSVRGSHPVSIHADANLKPDGYPKRTDRKSGIVEKSGSASKPEFEFTRLDFPELQGPEHSEISETEKQSKWGPLRSASADLSLLREVVKPAVVTAEGEGVVRSTDAAETMTGSAAADPASCTRELSWTPMGYVVRQTLSTEQSAAPKNVTSMINLEMVASSADSKSVSMSPPEVLSSDPSYKEKHIHSAKKDAEEFPNLAVASERRDRVASPNFQSQQQPQNNFKNSGKKSQIPVQLDLGGMLAALEKKQHSQSATPSSRPVVVSGKS